MKFRGVLLVWGNVSNVFGVRVLYDLLFGNFERDS